MANKSSSKSVSVTLFWILGLCAFVALMCGGFTFLLSKIDSSLSFLNTLKNIASIILTVAAVGMGWIWLSSTKMNKTLKIVLQVLFIIFAILAICGYVTI